MYDALSQNDKPQTRHARLIAEKQAREPQWRTANFRRTAVAMVARVNGKLRARDRMTDLVEMIDGLLRYIPDLYYVTDDPPAIAICEVECSHKVPDYKRYDFGLAGDMLVSFGIDLHIFIIDSHGTETEINWQDWHLEMIHCWAQESIAERRRAERPEIVEPSRVLPRPSRAPREQRPRQPARTLDEIIDAAMARRKRRPEAAA
jgi:hypothetical protein